MGSKGTSQLGSLAAAHTQQGNKKYSDETSFLIDQEVSRIIYESKVKCMEIIIAKK
jgi:ATP-dependent Zn protease